VANQKFKLLGHYNPTDKPNLMAQIFAVLVAAQAFTDPADKYPWLMAALVIVGAAYVSYLAIGAKSTFGLAILPTSLVFVDPALGGSLFTNIPVFFFAHAALALLFAGAAYTYLRAPARKK
jgi:hypothetical protein